MTNTKVGYRGGYEQKEREGEMKDKKKLVEDFDTVCQCARAWLAENGKDELWIDLHSTEIKQILSEMSCRKPDNDLVSVIIRTVADSVLPRGKTYLMTDKLMDEISKLLQGKT